MTIGTAVSKFIQSVEQIVDRKLDNVHTAIPGIVENYDEASQIAEVQPAVRRILRNGNKVVLPKCVEVPVLFPGGGGSVITFPIEVGDVVLLVFCERSIDGVVIDGKLTDAQSDRKHSYSDAVAIPGLLPKNTSYTKAKIKIETNGTVDINNGNLTVEL